MVVVARPTALWRIAYLGGLEQAGFPRSGGSGPSEPGAPQLRLLGAAPSEPSFQSLSSTYLAPARHPRRDSDLAPRSRLTLASRMRVAQRSPSVASPVISVSARSAKWVLINFRTSLRGFLGRRPRRPGAARLARTADDPGGRETPKSAPRASLFRPLLARCPTTPACR